MNNLVRLRAEERKDRRVYTPLAIVVLIETTGKGGQSRIGDCFFLRHIVIFPEKTLGLTSTFLAREMAYMCVTH